MAHQVTMGLITAAVLFALPVFATERIKAMDADAETVKLTIETTPGDRYQLQCCTNLVEGGWTNVGGEMIAVSSEAVHTVIPNASECYFRVIQTGSAGSTSEPPPPAEPPPPPPA